MRTQDQHPGTGHDLGRMPRPAAWYRLTKSSLGSSATVHPCFREVSSPIGMRHIVLISRYVSTTYTCTAGMHKP
jgi:hypothetical protein